MRNNLNRRLILISIQSENFLCRVFFLKVYDIIGDYFLALEGKCPRACGGGTFITGIREEIVFQDGKGWELSESSVGYFIGGAVEKSFPEKPFSLFIESEYNTSWESILNFKERGGVNVNLGVRFYFKVPGKKPK